jgi:uncharacterized protein
MVRSSLALGAIMLSGAVLAAPESLSKVDTAGGEILLEVQANGTAMTKIASVTTGCDLNASGSNKTEAQKQLTAKQTKLREAFKTEGVQGFTLDFSAPIKGGGDIEYPIPIEIPAEYAAAEGVAEVIDVAEEIPTKAPRKPMVFVSQRVKVTVENMGDLGKARYAFGDAGCNEDYSLQRRPVIVMADSSVAQGAAKAQAIASAKSQAEGYAAALGMRVVRIIRVSESGAIREFLGPESDFIIQEMRRDRNRDLPMTNEVPVSASIAVDFALGPK